MALESLQAPSRHSVNYFVLKFTFLAVNSAQNNLKWKSKTTKLETEISRLHCYLYVLLWHWKLSPGLWVILWRTAWFCVAELPKVILIQFKKLLTKYIRLIASENISLLDVLDEEALHESFQLNGKTYFILFFFIIFEVAFSLVYSTIRCTWDQ